MRHTATEFNNLNLSLFAITTAPLCLTPTFIHIHINIHMNIHVRIYHICNIGAAIPPPISAT